MRSIEITRDVLLLLLAVAVFVVGPLDINVGKNTPTYTDLERHSGTVQAYDCHRRAGRGEDILRVWMDGYVHNPLINYVGNDCTWLPQSMPAPVGKQAAVWVYPPRGANWMWQLVIDDKVLIDFTSERRRSLRGERTFRVVFALISFSLIYYVYSRKHGLIPVIKSYWLGKSRSTKYD